eukprot:maker-scaffold151_size306168-snap-gene-2.8 protein:Tk08769 transcript:maker-scaffold151_size306168-snap-gene-2.8-mRNA-1 annotation:"unnamed protein product"
MNYLDDNNFLCCFCVGIACFLLSLNSALSKTARDAGGKIADLSAVPDAPGKPLIMAFTSRSVNLSWTPPLNTHNSPISHYLILVRVGEGGAWDQNNIIETANNSTIFQVSDLLPFSTYSFRITAVNAIGRSHHSKESYYMITLREVPSGKPTITAAHNTSSTSIQISWRPPNVKTIHGEFLGYRIAYKPRNSGAEAVKEISIKDPSISKHIIQKLDIFTQYLVSLQVLNPEGLGPSTTVVVMTDEGVPSMPLNVSMDEVTNASLRLHWKQPSRPNGIIQGYRLYFMQTNFTDVRTVRNPRASMAFTLSGLAPFTKYRIWLKAFTWKNEGQPSRPFEMVTDVAGPGPPIITNLTCKDEQSIYLQWDSPRVVYKTVDYYYIYYRNEEQWQFKEVAVGMNGTLSKGSKILLEGLKTNSMHEVKVRGATRSVYDSSTVYKGEFSEAQKILLRLNCDQAQAFTIVRSSEELALDLSAGMIAGVACVAFSLILGLFALGLWRKYFNESYYYLDESPATPAPSIVPDWDSDPMVASTSDGTSTAIPISIYIQRVASLHADGDIGFTKEFETIQAISNQENGSTPSTLASRLPENQSKNRYPNVIAFDHSRVQLRPLPGQKRGEYVNANYIDGFQRARAYIATQGPLPATFDSFWRLVWEQKVKVLVMITNLVERGQRKCDRYWPREGTFKYGFIEVTLTREDQMATYTIRTFRIRHTRIRSGKQSSFVERYVLQYHYTHWPDHGVPETSLPLLNFVKRSTEANRETDSPILVHCSAGVGRTGAYILLDAMLKQATAKGEVNIAAFLKHIRSQRPHLVQSMEQYMFVHDALAEAFASGDTNINRAYLSRYISSLQSGFTTDENSIPWQLLDRQFKLATAYQPQEVQFMAALKPCNQSKNQNFDYLPIESYRVAMSAKPGVDGSDYVNASWMPGFHSLQDFIITQHPMEQTVRDFWRMVWDHSIKTVVVLSPLQQSSEFGIFWPNQQINIEVDSFRVRLDHEGETSGYQTKDFLMTSIHNDHELSIRVVFSPGWPHFCNPLNSITDLVKIVQSMHHLRKGPLVVVDRFGGTEAATFCAITSLLKQLEFENHVDIYEYAKLAHARRPGIWRSQTEYFFLYQAFDYICSGGAGFAHCDNMEQLHSLQMLNHGYYVNHPSNGLVYATGFAPPPMSLPILTNGSTTLPHPGHQTTSVMTIHPPASSMARSVSKANSFQTLPHPPSQRY